MIDFLKKGGISWHLRSGQPRQNPTKDDVKNFKQLLCIFQKLPYFLIRFFFPIDLMHHGFCNGVVANAIQLFLKEISQEKSNFSSEQKFNQYLAEISYTFPSHFGRKISFVPLKKFGVYKAEEIRTIGLKMFLPIFNNFLSENQREYMICLRGLFKGLESDEKNEEFLKIEARKFVQKTKEDLDKNVTMKGFKKFLLFHSVFPHF